MPNGARGLGRGMPGGGPYGPGPLLRALDSDGDGTISEREIAAATDALLALDANADGVLTPEELRPAPASGPGDPPRAARGGLTSEELFNRLDTDGDGLISKVEAPARMLQRWDTHDADGDGFIDPEELAAVRQSARDRAGNGTGDPNAKRPRGGRSRHGGRR